MLCSALTASPAAASLRPGQRRGSNAARRLSCAPNLAPSVEWGPCSAWKRSHNPPFQHRQAGSKLTCQAMSESGIAGASAEDVGDGEQFAVAIAQEADMLKGKDIVVLHVAPLVSWTSYMVLVSTFSRPQMQAVLFKVGKMALERFGRELPYSKQVSQGKDWECMDFGEVVVQVMTRESREYYDLESFYAAAEEVELPFHTERSNKEMDGEPGSASAGWQKKL
mmetsp:Transcript_30503/g.78910  ORF Transcript_30503/g.78910 Transcript_30503/m.78910 type:complete len:223 (-) Transcript_30503:67-735(-)